MEKSNLKNMEGWDGIAYNDGELAFSTICATCPHSHFPFNWKCMSSYL